MKMKKLVFLILIGLWFFSALFALPSQALRQRARKAKKSPASPGSFVSRGVRANIRFRPDRQGLLMNFSNFESIESISYELIYDANGISQGVGGIVTIGDIETKTLFFGTCSGGICTSHTNITNARLSIRSVLRDGTIVLKPYRIRV